MTDTATTATTAVQGNAEMCVEAGSAIERAFKLFGKRWTGIVIASLMGGPVHFADLRRTVPGISERMLSDRLTELQAAGVVVREVHAGPPLRVAYHLTAAGCALRPALDEIRAWAETHLPADTEPCNESGCG